MRGSLLAALLALLVCAPAEAATTVAREGDFELRAFEREGRLCMTLRRSGHYRGQACGRIPRSPHRPVRMFPDLGFNNYVAAVPPSVRFAETESRSGQRERHRTFAARGFFARFVLIPAPPVAKFVRYYAADGTLLGVDGGPAGYIGFNDQVQLLGDSGLGIETHTEPLLWPRPGDPGAMQTIGCIFATTSAGGNGWCDWNGEHGFVLLSECGRFDVAGGLVGAGVAGVRLTLGSGAQTTLAPSALPPPYGARRAIAIELPSGEALREVAALDGSGAVVARTPVGTPPAGQPCADEEEADDDFVGELVPVAPPPGAVAVTSASGESLLVTDQGERLCAGLARLRARTCPYPPADSDRPRLLRRGRAVAGVLSADAARVTLRLDRGTVTVHTTDGPAYTGRWAGGVRFFAATVPARREVIGAVVRNAAGTIIGVNHRGIPRRGEVHRRVILERDGLGLQLVRRTGHAPCLEAFAADLPPVRSHCTNLNPGTPIDGPFLPYSGTVVVPCSPRAALVFGSMGGRFATPSVLLDGGRTVRTRRIERRGKDAFVAFLPDARVRGLRSGDHRVALDLPPASSQCGYSADRAF